MESRPEGINPDYICSDEVIRGSFDSDEDYRQAVAMWPVCPQCGERRFVVCPVCGSAGNLFPLADAEYWDDSAAARPAEAVHHCGCGGDGGEEPHRCRCHGGGAPDSEVSADDLRWTSGIDQALSFTVEPPLLTSQTPSLPGVPNSKENLRLVSCAVCDEPFVPKFFPRCSCGYQFEAQQPRAEDEGEPTIDEETIARYRAAVHEQTFNKRTASACVLMLLIFLAGVGYLWWLFRQ
ncbi:MAG: hypothetical protein IIZ25_05115 [Thermoguttaceae bacterium]|nr:hypothetical protein [Thermoguttaceae bacterium]